MTTIQPELQYLDDFYIIGIAVRTINKDHKSRNDISILWQRFFSENILEKIPNKKGTFLYNAYTNYKNDHLDWYDCILGCGVSSLENIPDEMVGITVPKGHYKVFTSKGKIPKCVLETWKRIWKQETKRAYVTDFDQYDFTMNPKENFVKTFLSVRQP